jgi:hypothetical protein
MLNWLKNWWRGEYTPSTLDHVLHGGPGEGHYKRPLVRRALASIVAFLRGNQDKAWHDTAIGRVIIAVISGLIVAAVAGRFWSAEGKLPKQSQSQTPAQSQKTNNQAR